MKKIFSAAAVISLLLLIIPTVAFISQSDPPSARETFLSSSESESGRSASSAAESGSDSESSSESTAQTSAGNVIYKVYDVSSDKVLSLKASDYIKGVVGAEIPASYETEAIKAQAVAANTYALRIIAQNNTDESLKGASLSTDPNKYQAYKSKKQLKKIYGADFEKNYKKISDAVDEVIDQVIVYNDEPIAAVFHAVSAGMTENSEDVWGNSVSYLKSVKSEKDKTSPDYSSTVSFKASEVKSKLKNSYEILKLPLFKSNWFKITTRSNAGSVEKIKIGNIEAAGQDIRLIFSLHSSNFTVSYKNDVFTFETKGYGHGVGLSQYGANELAKQGKSYKEILTHYYTGVTIKKIS